MFASTRPVPEEYRANFSHLYWDMIGFGVLNGTTIAFLGVYAARLGASASQIGLLSAVPGLVSLIFSLPVGSWLTRRSVGKVVFWSSVLQRVFYLVFVIMPLALLPGAQIWLSIMVYFVMNVPATALTVGFNALFAEAAPSEWRGHVFGGRMALLSIFTTTFSLLSGQILARLPFPIGYEVVFFLGFAGAMLSSYHLYFLSHICEKRPAVDQPRREVTQGAQIRQANSLNQLYRRGLQNLHLDLLRGKFGRIMLLFFCWHFAQWLVIPTVTPYIVNDLHISDALIGLASGLFNMATFFGSLRLSRLTGKWGNKAITGIGVMGVGLYPLLLSLARGPEVFLLANLVGGMMWSMAGGASLNYILENVPGSDRSAYMAWYSVVMNAAILFGSLAGPALGGQIGFAQALFLYAFLRFAAGASILHWG